MKKAIYLIILGLAVFSSVVFAMSCGADMSHEGHGKAPQKYIDKVNQELQLNQTAK